MGLLLLLMFLTFAFNIWLLVRIWKSSPLIAIISFFFFPASIISLVQNWDDEELDVRVPFFATCGAYLALVLVATKMMSKIEEMESALQGVSRLMA
jgi:hypothetical protein